MFAALVEYTARQLMLGPKANPNGLARVGLAMVVAGETMRKVAMVRTRRLPQRVLLCTHVQVVHWCRMRLTPCCGPDAISLALRVQLQLLQPQQTRQSCSQSFFT